MLPSLIHSAMDADPLRALPSCMAGRPGSSTPLTNWALPLFVGMENLSNWALPLHVNYTIWLFERRFSQIDPLETYFRSEPFKWRQTYRRPYWTKGRQWFHRPSLHIRTGRNRRTSKLLASYLNWRASLMLMSCSVHDLCHLVHFYN
jgi:hypothetical protein